MIKELIIKYLKEAGYDTFSACELAHNKIKELQNSPSGTYNFVCGNKTMTVVRK